MKLVLATRNRKKATEILRVLGDEKVEILTLDDFPGCPEVEEDGDTFTANAMKKAMAVAGYTGLPALADDSGLEVVALNHAPGVRSARYAGDTANDAANLQLLMQHMQDQPQRQARFVCALVWADGQGGSQSFIGEVTGEITHHAKGSNGFGYDPVFQPQGWDRTFAEMTAGEKDALSHRGRALRAFAAWYKKTAPDETVQVRAMPS